MSIGLNLRIGDDENIYNCGIRAARRTDRQAPQGVLTRTRPSIPRGTRGTTWPSASCAVQIPSVVGVLGEGGACLIRVSYRRWYRTVLESTKGNGLRSFAHRV
jgi:hypothetical protein